ncbi:hypothetical protein BCR33DRAFT_723332 [Rhizoclosmatium globosum]|uniref:Uncharacterized protein n=1 Tax=Rhizoclosmatium globosum TaxID=329046 RepID=A0A1Y2BEV3_9FUNG|nr:hypothetical protein BCR33DRAFT_723332 [Rhizoclosmatium globosum]|eukprot:ORY32987.1 hypothetical protein BCR33DRAFT_723332 [Rhizoclosmatium globosum]
MNLLRKTRIRGIWIVVIVSTLLTLMVLLTQHKLSKPSRIYAVRSRTTPLPPISNSLGSWVPIADVSEIAMAAKPLTTSFPTRHGGCHPYHTSETTQTKFRFPNNTRPRGIIDFWNLLHSKRILVIGDSVVEQFYESWVLASIDAGLFVETVEPVNPVPGTQAGSSLFPITRTSYRVDDSVGKGRKHVITLDQVRWAISQVDVVLIGFGMHYTNNATDFAGFEDAMRHVTMVLEGAVKMKGLVVVWKDMTPNFYQGGQLPDKPRLCGNRRIEYREHNDILTKVFSRRKGFYNLNTRDIYWDKWEAKKGKFKSGSVLDCVHFCHNPFIFEPILNGIYEIIHRHYEAKGAKI